MNEKNYCLCLGKLYGDKFMAENAEIAEKIERTTTFKPVIESS